MYIAIIFKIMNEVLLSLKTNYFTINLQNFPTILQYSRGHILMYTPGL